MLRSAPTCSPAMSDPVFFRSRATAGSLCFLCWALAFLCLTLQVHLLRSDSGLRLGLRCRRTTSSISSRLVGSSRALVERHPCSRGFRERSHLQYGDGMASHLFRYLNRLQALIAGFVVMGVVISAVLWVTTLQAPCVNACFLETVHQARFACLRTCESPNSV